MSKLRYEFIAAAQARGWHYANALKQLNKATTPEAFQTMLKSAVEYAEDTAKKFGEVFNKKDATQAFEGSFKDHPRIP